MCQTCNGKGVIKSIQGSIIHTKPCLDCPTEERERRRMKREKETKDLLRKLDERKRELREEAM
ncbi:hypothetical protein [Alteribacter populi]|uniref:hypothetical protein n=1 Tax=Alteribacter populi TaxID=2011011 RepID=UPI000BBB0A6B|nr:hypothetical protein [Alteribacter populi]